MAALMIAERTGRSHGRCTRRTAPIRPELRLVAEPSPVPGARQAARVVRSVPARRATPATFRRRRLAVLMGVVAVLAVVGQAGAALGSNSLAAAERGPAAVRYVVHPGDTLWSAAEELAPDEDPRSVVDVLVEARGDGPLRPGEVLRWQR